jgi:hypothetical protein
MGHFNSSVFSYEIFCQSASATDFLYTFSSRKSLATHVNIILVSVLNVAKMRFKNYALYAPTAKADNKMQHL